MMPVRAIVSVSIAVAAIAVLSAQAPSAPSQDFPTFRSGVQLVEVDVIVTDRQGNSVRNLTKDDFEIIDDDRVQSVRTFSLVDLPVPPLPPAPVPGRVDVQPDTATNANASAQVITDRTFIRRSFEKEKHRHASFIDSSGPRCLRPSTNGVPANIGQRGD